MRHLLPDPLHDRRKGGVRRCGPHGSIKHGGGRIRCRGARRIIYLGGLGDTDHPDLSKHLRSRHEVEEIFRNGSVPVTCLRAAMILGSGSASFEMLRYLADRLPVMVTPRWVNTPCQPISISNVLGYLHGCLEAPGTIGKTFDIGGPEVISYRDLIHVYAEAAGLMPRIIFPVPVLTPKLSSLWIHLVTPVPAAIARPLAEGLSIPVVCGDDRIRSIVPLDLQDCRETMRIALAGPPRRSRMPAHFRPAPISLRNGRPAAMRITRVEQR
jgi:uncharacterized protein YbjT (DUF2867 family)